MALAVLILQLQPNLQPPLPYSSAAGVGVQHPDVRPAMPVELTRVKNGREQQGVRPRAKSQRHPQRRP